MIGIGMSVDRQQRGQMGGGPPPGPQHHVFVVAGQSNSVGRAADDGANFPAGVLDWNGSAFAPVGSRLAHLPGSAAVVRPAAGANFGFARSFATSYLAANPGVTLCLIGAGLGGTGFVNNDWNRGNATYAQSVARVNAAMAAAPAGAVLRGILWHQGENDALNGGGISAYPAALSTFVSDYRTDIVAASATTPFVLGGHFINVSGNYQTLPIQTAIQSIPNAIPFTGYADPSSPTEATLFDGVHLDAASTTRFGPRFHAGLIAAQANTGLSQGGTITTGTLARHNLPDTLSGQVSNVALGTPAADRLIVMAVVVRATFAVNPVAVRVGGIDMERMGFPGSGNSAVGVTLFAGRVANGATGTVEVTFDGMPRSGQVGFVLLPTYGARAHLASAAGFARRLETTSRTSLNVSVAASAGDLLFAVSGSLSPTAASGTIDLADTATGPLSGGNVAIHAGWMIQPNAQPATRTITCGYSSAVNAASMSALVLRPM